MELILKIKNNRVDVVFTQLSDVPDIELSRLITELQTLSLLFIQENAKRTQIIKR